MLHNCISVFDARLPATTTLNTNNDIQFPGETKLNYSDVRGAAQIVIPTVILNQFSSEGTYVAIRIDDAVSNILASLCT